MDHRISCAVSLIEKRFNRRLTLREMARSVQLSPSRFRHLFKAQTGVTPAQYLKSVRMREAKKLMRKVYSSVKEVMTNVGLNDKSHFERDFKKTYGLTPAQYITLSMNAQRSPDTWAQNDRHIGHQIASSAINSVLHSWTGDSNLSPFHMFVDDSEIVVSHTNTSTKERRVPPMEKIENIVDEPQQFDELFEELSVTELEDRLELSARCVCRNSDEVS